jgi:iron complex outermembrane receptor protein
MGSPKEARASIDLVPREEFMTSHASRTRSLLLASAALGLVVAAPQVIAAEAATPAATGGGTSVEEVVITARKREERLIDVPVSANAISGAALQRAGITDMTQVGNTIAQVSIDKAPSGSGAIITIRGIGSSAVDGSIEQEVTVNIDGVPTSRGRVLYQAAFDESSVEVLKGPQALYFGKNSPAGVISINSTNPGQESEGYARVGVEAESQTYFGEFAATLPISNVLSARIAFRGSDMIDGYIRDEGGPITAAAQLPGALAAAGLTLPGAPYRDKPAETEEIGRLSLLYKPNSKFDANFKFLISNHQDRGAAGEIVNISCHGSKPGSIDYATFAYLVDPYGSCGHTTISSSGTLPAQIAAHYPGSNNGTPYSETVSILSSLTMNYHLTDSLLLTSVTGFFKTRDTGWDNFDYTDLTAASGENDEFNTSWTEEVRASSSFSGPVNFTAGVFYEHDDRHFIQNGAIGYFGPDPATGQTNTFSSTQFFGGHTYSGFGELNWKILPRLELAGGARYTVEEKGGNTGSTFLNQAFPLINFIASPVGERIIGSFTEHNVSPQVTLSYHVAPDILLYGAYKTGFKSGGFSSPALIPFGATAQNQEFGQEKVHGGEVGFKFSHVLGGLTGDVTVYDYQYTGLQLTAFEPPAAYFTQNAGSATTKGIEVNLSERVTRAFSVHGTVGYNHARYDKFDNSQCWDGQTAAEGCVGGVQNLSGAPLSRAPDWTALAGVSYDVPVANAWNVGVTVDGRYSDGYFTGVNNNPYGYQNQYEALDATVRLYDSTWEFSLVGRNLTNTIYYLLSSDKPLGLRGDVDGTIGRPREVLLQATRRF